MKFDLEKFREEERRKNKEFAREWVKMKKNKKADEPEEVEKPKKKNKYFK